MKKKLTFLLFSLLLAVGWTSSAFAQSKTLKAADMAGWKYKWLPENATDSVEANYVEFNEEKGIYMAPEVTNPYQIYDLLRAVYMDKRLPGPLLSAYDSSDKPSLTPGDRIDEVYYGGIGGGWNIGATTGAFPTNNIVITGNYYVYVNSVTLIADGEQLETWSASTATTNNLNLPTGWSSTRMYKSTNQTSSCYFGTSSNPTGSITIPYSHFSGHSTVKVVVTAFRDPNSSDYATLDFNGYTQQFSSTTVNEYDLVISAPETLLPKNTYRPAESNEGYTALIVKVKNGISSFPYAEPSSYVGSCSFNSKQEIIDYIAMTIDGVKLLTDGLRIGSGYSQGTVFNCDGTYNRFFFLSKGQARKKSDYVETQISSGAWPSYAGEELPFKQMYEEFSPTTGEQGDEITDFYSEMMEGHVYNVVHDCASVIQNAHQFSMSGNAGETAYGMTGLNFFIPDYRLMLWWTTKQINGQTRQYVDGRDFVAYQYYQNGQWVSYTANNTAQVWSAKYAQYNQLYAPKIGIYRITLEAEAHPCSGYDETNKPYYEVTLNWTSSLNEMSNEDVPQTYVIYEVTYNAQTGEEELVPLDTLVNPTTLTYTLPCPPNYKQEDHSVTHTYVIQGWPIDNDHPSFIAWSNQDDVVIPGLKDFLSLDLDHYESDFIISEEKNYYRNFLMVTNENETKAITTADLMNGMNKYKLYRYDLDKPESLEPFAEINFTKPTSVDATTVSYTITYEDQTIEGGNNSKYARSAMGIPDNGTLSVKGSGDVIIWPNDLSVNFMEITVTSGNTPLLKWTANSATPTTGSNRWHLSPGCKWVKYGNAYYLEGMGYIYINAGTTGDVTVTIKAYGDGSTTSKITVNDVTRTIVNGAANATTYNWTVPAANRAPMRDGNGLDNNATNN